jgi:hypothetical protein
VVDSISIGQGPLEGGTGVTFFGSFDSNELSGVHLLLFFSSNKFLCKISSHPRMHVWFDFHTTFVLQFYSDFMF